MTMRQRKIGHFERLWLGGQEAKRYACVVCGQSTKGHKRLKVCRACAKLQIEKAVDLATSTTRVIGSSLLQGSSKHTVRYKGVEP